MLYPVYTIEQTSSRPDGTPPSGSNVGLGLAHSWSRAFQLQPARPPNEHAN